MPDKMSTSILSCPFCGSQPILVHRKVFKEFFMSCPTKTCNIMVGRIWGNPPNWQSLLCKTKEEAILRWNTRAETKEFTNIETKDI